MIHSMTGYGRAQQMVQGYDITVEIKSVNHRYFEFSGRFPRRYGYLECEAKRMIQKRVTRGKVECCVFVVPPESENKLCFHSEMAQGYLQSLREANRVLQLEDNLSLAVIAQLPDVFTLQPHMEDENDMLALFCPVLVEALVRFLQFKEQEGAALMQNLLEKTKQMAVYLAQVEQASAQTQQNYRVRLEKKLREVLEGQSVPVEESRILTEVAIFADKISVDEETVRLHSHLAQFKELLHLNTAAGKKCDFLVQEMHREINTIGSKASDLSIAKTVIEMKTMLEKIREQIQNIE